jgi:GT2 family glycosyltransferase
MRTMQGNRVPDMSERFTTADVTVVTVSYNSAEALSVMLPSLPADTKVVIVNNAGRDGKALETLAGERPNTHVIHQKKNFGFGDGCNIGAGDAKTEFTFLLNPDTIVQDGAIEALIAAAQRHDPQSAFNPKISYQDGRPHFKRRSVLLPRSQWLPRGWPETECEVPVLAGSAIFCRTRLLRRIAFDTNIFLYHEDDEWSLRIKRSGGSLVFVPDAHVTHLAGKSSGSSPGVARFKGFHLGRSRIYAMEESGIPLARLRCMAHALGQFLSPLTWISKRKKAKAQGMWEGIRSSQKMYRHAEEMPARGLGIPFWKLKRELRRLGRDFVGAPRAFHDRFLSTAIYDLLERKKVERFDGNVPRGDRVAVFLIFPKNGLLESHKRSIAYIRDNGYAPFVVSNLPMSDADQAYLSDHTWKFLSRPNRGYDFGGYREAFMSLQDDIKDLKYLCYLNDSSWFPVPGTANWFDEAEALNVDYAAAATSYSIQRVPLDRYQTIHWELDTKLRDFHYCSYALLVGRNILQDPRYRKYWRSYVLTERKNKVVRRGEMGMSRFAVDNGFSHAAIYDLTTLPDVLDTCTDEELYHFANSMVLLGDEDTKKSIAEIVPTLDARRSIAERNDTIKLLMTTAARIGVSYVLPEFLHSKHRFPFVKKSPVGIDKSDSDVMVQFAERLGGKDGEIIRAEMQMIRQAKGFLNDPAPDTVHVQSVTGG